MTSFFGGIAQTIIENCKKRNNGNEPDSQLILDEDALCKMEDKNTLTEIYSLTDVKEITTIALSPLENYIAIGDIHSKIQIWKKANTESK